MWRAFAVNIVLVSLSTPAWAIKVSTKTLRTKAYITKAQQGLYAALDLKEKTLRFGWADRQRCRARMHRKPETLSYSCQLPIPTNANTSLLRQMRTQNEIVVHHGRLKKAVQIKISKDAKNITFFTEFDTSGVDFEWADLNDEIMAVYNETAAQLFAQLMKKHRIKLQTLEN